MVKWSKSLVKILIFRNVSKFVFVQILNKLTSLNATTLSYLQKVIKLDNVVEFGKRFSKLCTSSIFLVTLCHRLQNALRAL